MEDDLLNKKTQVLILKVKKKLYVNGTRVTFFLFSGEQEHYPLQARRGQEAQGASRVSQVSAVDVYRVRQRS